MTDKLRTEFPNHKCLNCKAVFGKPFLGTCPYCHSYFWVRATSDEGRQLPTKSVYRPKK